MNLLRSLFQAHKLLSSPTDNALSSPPPDSGSEEHLFEYEGYEDHFNEIANAHVGESKGHSNEAKQVIPQEPVNPVTVVFLRHYVVGAVRNPLPEGSEPFPEFREAIQRKDMQALAVLAQKRDREQDYTLHGHARLLNYAAELGDIEAIKTLVAAGLDLKFAYAMFESALRSQNAVEVILYLVSTRKFKIYDADNGDALAIACKAGNIDAIRALIKLYDLTHSSLTLWNKQPLAIAAANNKIEVANVLMEPRVPRYEVEEGCHAALIAAIEKANCNMILFLLKQYECQSKLLHPEISDLLNESLNIAMKQEHRELLTYLTENLDIEFRLDIDLTIQALKLLERMVDDDDF